MSMARATGTRTNACNAVHPIPEVRWRAVRSLQFKLQNGLLEPESVANDPSLLSSLLRCWAAGVQADADQTANAVALDVLSAIARHPDVAAQLLALGTDQLVLSLQARLPPYLSGLADQLLADLHFSRRTAGWNGDRSAAACYTVPDSLMPGQPGISWSPLALPCPDSKPGTCSSPPAAQQLGLPAMPCLGMGGVTAWEPLRGSSRGEVSGCYADALAQHGLHVKTVRLSEADQHQLEDLLQQLEHSDTEAVRMAVAQLQGGALEDLPVEGLLAGTDVIAALLQLIGGSAASSLPEAAAACLHQLVRSIGIAVADMSSNNTNASTPVSPVAHQLLRACCGALGDVRLHYILVPLLADLLPLTQPTGRLPLNGVAATAFCCSWRAALAALGDALHLALVGVCTEAGVLPPEGWRAPGLDIVVDARVKLLLDLATSFVQSIPAQLVAEAMPDGLGPLLGCIYSSPLVPTLLPHVKAALEPHISTLAPGAKLALDAADCLTVAKLQLLSAVQQLAELSCRPGGTVQAACSLVIGCLADLSLLPQQEAAQAIHSVIQASAACCEVDRTAGAPASVSNLVAAVLAHPLPAARYVAVCSLADHLSGSGRLRALQLVADPLVLGVMVTLGLADTVLQAQVVDVLLQANALDTKCIGAALLTWRPWLVCYRHHPAIGAAIGSLLQVAQQQLPCAALWQQLQPQLMDIFSTAAAVRAQAASQLFSAMLAHQQTNGVMAFHDDPFAGCILPAVQQGSVPSPQWGNRAAAALFSLEDIQGLVHAACSMSVPTEVTAQALAQLATVASDSRFYATLGAGEVLATLMRWIQGPPAAGPDVLQPAFDCLVQILSNIPTAASWLLEDADRRALAIVPLVFHPKPAARHMAAQALNILMFSPVTLQWLSLQQQLSPEQHRAPHQNSLMIPAPFAKTHMFPGAARVTVNPVEPSMLESASSSGEVLRLWEAQHMVQMAASTDGGLAGLLCEHDALTQPWKHSFLCAALLTKQRLDIQEQLKEALQQLQQARNHKSCHTALDNIRLLCCSEKQGASILARQDWCSDLLFLVARAPISPDDVQLWMALLPMLRQIIYSHQISTEDLQLLAAKFVGGSALQWLSSNLPEMAHSESAGAACQLTQEVMQLCSAVMEEYAHRAVSAASAGQMLHFDNWLQLLQGHLCSAAAPYSTKLAAASLLASMADFVQQAASSTPSACALQLQEQAQTGAGLVDSIAPLVRHVLLPKHKWHPEHCHGKALVKRVLAHLLRLTQLLPADEWSARWADVGGTYWLSRLARDQQASVRQLAFSLLAALVLQPATHAMLQSGWCECGSTVCIAAANAECAEVRAAALHVVVAAMSHTAARPEPQTLAEVLPAGCNLDLVDDVGASRHSYTLNAAYLRKQAPLWSTVVAAAQDSSCPPCLLEAATHALLQYTLMDTLGAWKLLSGAVKRGSLGQLVFLPLQLVRQWCGAANAIAEDASSLGGRLRAGVLHLPSAAWEHLGHALAAAAAMAEVLTTLVQLVPDCQPHICQANMLASLLSACAQAAAVCAAALPVCSPPVASSVQSRAWPVLNALANAAALLLAKPDTWHEEAVRRGASEGPVPLAVAVATAMQVAGCSSGNVATACGRLLQLLLSRPGWASAFLQDQAGALRLYDARSAQELYLLAAT